MSVPVYEWKTPIVSGIRWTSPTPRQVWRVSYTSPTIGVTGSHYYSWRSAMRYALAVARWSLTRPKVRRVR